MAEKLPVIDADTNIVSESLDTTWPTVRCQKTTRRHVEQGVKELNKPRKAIEKYIKNGYLRDIQAPVGAKPMLLPKLLSGEIEVPEAEAITEEVI